MKKREKNNSLRLCLLFFLIVATFYGCSEANEDTHISVILDVETEIQLKNDFWLYVYNDTQREFFTVDEVKIDYYLGTYNG